MKRWLLHGPCLNDPGDLLFFDAWVQPLVAVRYRPANSPPLSAGYPVREAWPKPVLDTLRAAGRLLAIGDLIWSGAAEAAGAELAEDMQARIADAAALAADGFFIPLDTPASDAEVQAWLAAIDTALRKTTARLVQRGHGATSKQFASGVTRVFKPGWELALALELPAFPRIDRAIGSLDALLAFLADEGTAVRREALLGALREAGQRPAASVAAEVVAAAHALAGWVEASGLASGRGPVELVWALPDATLTEALAAAPLGDAERAVARLRTRGLAAGEAAGAGADTPLMLVSRRPRGYPAW
jgi:hypothetical protein